MSPILVFGVIASYFSLLLLISYFTGKKSNSASFFTANRRSPWYLVAFGMIGASLSGVTFISVPGDVGNINLYYFQMVLGYLVGYAVIALVLLPLYYKNNLISIYQFLDYRFGKYSYKTGSAFFLLSRIIGASFRLFLVAGVLHLAFFAPLKIPFALTVIVTVFLIWIYTYKAGIKTVVYTDTLQTTFMLLSVIFSIYFIAKALNFDFSSTFSAIKAHPYSKIFDWNSHSPTNFYKQFLAGAFIAIVMTGLDQDMMQKNLTVKTLKESQKNILWFSFALVPVNLLFMTLGVLLYIYGAHIGLEFVHTEAGIRLLYEGILHSPDDLFPIIAITHIGGILGIFFLIGIIAAAFSSADSALTALTTAFSIDFLHLNIEEDNPKNRKIRRIVHLSFSFILIVVILLFRSFNNSTVITALFRVAGYTYGPLLGLFTFGLISHRKVKDKYIPIVAVLSPILTYFIGKYSAQLFWGYRFGFELLLVNGLLMFLGIWILSYNNEQS